MFMGSGSGSVCRVIKGWYSDDIVRDLVFMGSGSGSVWVVGIIFFDILLLFSQPALETT